MKTLSVAVFQCIIGRQIYMVCLCLSNASAKCGGEGDEGRQTHREHSCSESALIKAGQEISLVPWTEGKLPLLTNLDEIVVAHFLPKK